ncbi:MAG: serine hydrolase domain-containing protein [Leptospirillia bacterium]
MRQGEAAVREMMEAGCREGVFPGGVVLWGDRREIRGEVAVGVARQTPPEPLPPVTPRTIFDLASLTKPLVTAALVLLLVSEGRMALDSRLSESLSAARGTRWGEVSLRDLLSHASGLPAWAPLYMKIDGNLPVEERKRQLVGEILSLAPAKERGKTALYSDFGFMLLGWALEERSGERLDTLFRRRLVVPLGLSGVDFLSEGSSLPWQEPDRDRYFAATEVDPESGEPLVGVVHDEHARCLGGVSGHAGLFATARGVWQLARPWMARKGERGIFPEELLVEFTRRREPLEWALGFDTPTPDSSSGTRMTPGSSIGHLGYAGTSLWMDRAQDRIVVLLTNRVHPTRTNNRIREFRPRLHDRVAEAF